MSAQLRGITPNLKGAIQKISYKKMELSQRGYKALWESSIFYIKIPIFPKTS